MITLNDLKRQNQRYAGELKQALETTLLSGWYVLGEKVRQFETGFAKACGAEHAIGVANGTDALEIALRAVGVKPGDAVATVANAGLYSSIAINAIGAKPVFVEVDPQTMNMDPVALAALIKQRPRALVITHLYGRMAAVAQLIDMARAHQIAVVEDCAQAHGARRDGKHAGTFGDIGGFSFYPTKNLGALGDGGALITNNSALAASARRLRQYGWEPKYHAVEIGGRNSRLDEIQAAVLSVKLRYLDRENARRREIALAYESGIRNAYISTFKRGGSDDVVHLYVVCSEQRDALKEHLLRAGVQSDIHYPLPDYQQPAWTANYKDLHLTVTEKLAATVLSLPCHPALTHEEVVRVINACNSFKP